ncbi:MAG TPA: arginine--tRNA ligase [Tepidisphaeraceae bacterium]|nr:arginine--tRNA ligase [Tepidisphaeraceae bacterium]
MPTILSQLDAAFRNAIRAAFGVDAEPILVPSQNEKFGDYQSNAAMGLAKQLGQQAGQKANPRQVAEQIKAKLDLGGMASEISIAGPGFINVRLNPAWLAKQLQAAAAEPRLGIPLAAPPQTIVVDLSGPNVAKELHVGHLRSTIIGDAIARVLEFLGHRVIRQNHLGDWGTQFGMLITHLRSTTGGGQDAHIEDLDRFYKEARKRFDAEPDFADTARATVVKLQGGGEEELALWRRIVEETRRHFQPLYARLNVKLTADDERGESFYNPMLPAVVADLKQAGIATESEGATVAFVEGHSNPLIIEKSGGGFLYGTTDLAAVRYRVQTLRADRVVYVVGAPQGQHFAQVFATARRAGWAGGASLEHAPFGSVLGEDGKMFKARSGESVKLVDLLDEAEQRALKLVTDKSPDLPEEQRRAIARAVGVGAIKYADLSKDRIGDYTFSFDQMLSMDGNTAPYLQYAHARIKSIFRKAGLASASAATVTAAALKLDAPQELALAKHVLRFGDVLEQVARELKPHHLTNYLYELATRFSAFYENCPVLQSEEPTRSSRLLLSDATARSLATGLELLGIEHPEQM